MANESKLRVITEFVGGLSIVVSLVFVGLELRHANNVAEVDSVLQINAMYADMLTAAHHDESLIRMIAENNGREAAAVRLGFRNLTMLNIVEAAWKSFDRGIMEEDHFLSYVNDLCANVFPDGLDKPVVTSLRDVPWPSLRPTLSPQFADVVETSC